ncbi:MAG: LOG family protein [Acidimicrobiales bacterium]
MAVVGGYDADHATEAAAEAVGRLLAQRGAVVVTGGRQGVAAAASRGAVAAGGLTVGILPGRSRAEANPWVQVAVPTGLGETRNALVVMDADAVIAFPGRYGTLSEVAFALLAGTIVIGLGTWDVDGVLAADSPEEAVTLALPGDLRTPHGTT